VLEVGLLEVGVLEVGLREVGVLEIPIAQSCPMHIYPTQPCIGKHRTEEI